MSNINDCTKFEDNQSKQSGLRVQTSVKNRWRQSWKQDGGFKMCFFLEVVPLDPREHRKSEDDILHHFVVMGKSEGEKSRKKF